MKARVEQGIDSKTTTTTATTSSTTNSDSCSIPKIHGTVISGDVSYDIFLQNLRRIKTNQNERLVINFHRGVLFGYRNINTYFLWFSFSILLCRCIAISF